MAIKGSKPYEIGGNKYSFAFQDGKLLGANKVDASNDFVSNASLDSAILQSDAVKKNITEAYNETKYKSDTNSYVESFDDIEQSTDAEKSSYFDLQAKKYNNQQYVETDQPNALAQARPGEEEFYSNPDFNYDYKGSDIMMYPSDMNTSQDHFKIMKYNYQRKDINASKPRRTEVQTEPDNNGVERTVSVAGDSVVGSKLLGSVLLPMPKVTDVNGVEWGKSDLTISGLAALGAVDVLTNRGRFAGKSQAEKENDQNIKTELEKLRGTNPSGSSPKNFASATYTQVVSKLAGFAFGTDLDADTYLARSGGRVLNPNAEMLFQGPVIRDFSFSFLMIARNEKEGREIRRIIRFLKLGMAPKFRNTTYLKNPDIFTLQYKSGKGENDVLDTVNRFNPGGLALTTMAVDYAPNGYWSAYRDSQPVAVKMDLSFTELRPIYEQDQLETPSNSVGY